MLRGLRRVESQASLVEQRRQVERVQPGSKLLDLLYFAPEERAAVLVLVLVVEPDENAELEFV